MRFVTPRAKTPPISFWMNMKPTTLSSDQQIRWVARRMEARLRREMPQQWGTAIDIVMPKKPVASAIGAEWSRWDIERVDAMRAFEWEHHDILHWAVDDGEVCARARRCAGTVDDMLNGHALPMSRQDRLDVVLDYCDRVGVDKPVAQTPEGLIARALNEQWWRRALRRKVARTVELAAIKLAVVHHKNGGYASDEACRRRIDQNQRNADLLKRVKMRNEAGQVYSLAELAALSPSNRDIRRGELMTRIRGCEEYADANGHQGLFLTLTCPSRYHAVLSGGKSRWAKPRKNDKFEGDSPRDAQKWLCNMWAKARAKMARKGIQAYGFRVAEPHHDGCPHWHALLWFHTPEQAQQAQQIISGYWLSDAGDEAGAVRNRCKFIAMTRGGAAGYVAKYVAKNIGAEDGGDVGVGQHTDTIDGFEHVMDTREFKGWQRVDAWASIWGIRQFQAIGQPSVTVWREMRRVTKDQIDRAQLRLDFGDTAAVKAWYACQKFGEGPSAIKASWDRYVRAQGGMCKKRRDWMLRTATRVTEGCTNVYGETITRKTVVGVETRIGHWLVSRRQAWKSCAGEAEQDKAQRAALGRPWTRFNNCTARITREPLRQLTHGDLPWPKVHDTDEILPLASKKPPPAPPAEPIYVIAGERTTFRMPDPGIAAAAALIRQAEVRPPAAAAAVPAPRAIDDIASPEFAAFAARVKAGAARLRALAAASH
ncbi:replication endonuclease [Variovorax ureilyticus]|uniref:replication endonuclease n=1 Tax=Variovorax ureilyticus TaxID=1836198 RepID=UPI003D66BD58